MKKYINSAYALTFLAISCTMLSVYGRAADFKSRTLGPDSVSTQDIQDSAVTDAKLNDAKLSLSGGGTVSGNVNLSASSLQQNSVNVLDTGRNLSVSSATLAGTLTQGQSSTASGVDSVAMAGGTASGDYSLALGTGSTASGHASGALSGLLNSATSAYATVPGGLSNTANDIYATVGGGRNNAASAQDCTIAGGFQHTCASIQGTIAGGWANFVHTNSRATIGGGFGNIATGLDSVIAGGILNTSTENGSAVGGGGGNDATGFRSTVPGGRNSEANGDYSFSAGREAVANADGSWAWADSRTGVACINSSSDSMKMCAQGGVEMDMDGATLTLDSLLKLQPQSAAPSCGAGDEGLIYADSDSNELCYCDGTSFTGLKAAGACS